MDPLRRRRRIMTKRVHPEWYRRYAKVLNYDERTYVQPLREIKEEQAMLKALETPPNDEDRAVELSRKLTEARSKKIKLVLQILEGNMRHFDLSSLKPTCETPLSLIQEEEKQVQTLFWRKRAIRPPGYKLSPKSKWRLFWASPKTMEKFDIMVKQRKRNLIVAKWQKANRLILALNRFHKELGDIARTTAEVFKNYVENNEEDANKVHEAGSLNFNKKHFKSAGTGKALDVDNLFTFCKPERYRTPEQIEQAAESLKVLRSFAEFPKNLQIKICQVAWYIETTSDKIIIREGQPANSFYFLLAGRVASVKIDTGTLMQQNTVFDILETHSMGALLGEEGITTFAARDYSLYTLEKCKFIGVSIDDWRRVCLEVEVEGANPEHITFLSQLNFMKFFPMRMLVVNPEDNIQLFYYSNGSVISKDTTASEFVYCVFKGSCKVIAEIQKKHGHRKKKVHLPPLLEYTDGFHDDAYQFSPGSSGTDSVDSLTSWQTRSKVIDKSVRLMEDLTRSWGRGTVAACVKERDNMVLNIQLLRAGSVEKLLLNRVTKNDDRLQDKLCVLLKTLREGDVIGLEGMDIGDIPEPQNQAKTALVSEGAVIVSIYKEFILNNATPLMKKDMRASSYILPSDAQIRSELSRRHTWRRFQDGVMKEVFSQKRFTKNTYKHGSKNTQGK